MQIELATEALANALRERVEPPVSVEFVPDECATYHDEIEIDGLKDGSMFWVFIDEGDVWSYGTVAEDAPEEHTLLGEVWTNTPQVMLGKIADPDIVDKILSAVGLLS